MEEKCSICGDDKYKILVCDECGLLFCNSGECGGKMLCKECILERSLEWDYDL